MMTLKQEKINFNFLKMEEVKVYPLILFEELCRMVLWWKFNTELLSDGSQ
jgi:hypothetical protein